LGITAVDPVNMDLLFERFMSLERHEPPDIDVDFEHERREEVIQEVYRRYGRSKSAMVATVICFRTRMAVRETAKALGISNDAIGSVIEFMGREGMPRLTESDRTGALKECLKEHGIGPQTWTRLLALAPRMRGLPRHLSIHTGGFVLSSERLDEMCILEPARMQDRSVIPWDKDDVDALHWMKVDLLSLGILTAIRKSFEYCAQARPEAPFGQNFHTNTLAALPKECPQVYAALQRADTVGVFQVESRAQMSMLPRLAPRNFYDLVIEIAIVRPGPLQGGMVHPYLSRRQNPKLVAYDHEKLKPILEKTLGVPIFQEQVMKIAVAVGGFLPGEADQLRKVMSGAWRARSHMSVLKQRLFDGMAKHGLSGEFAERIYKQIEGFGEYGFPESHSASFSILAYASAWLKVHRPSEFLCAMLNSQPMGFYSPPLLIADAERHGVVVLPIDILSSRWDCTVEPNPFDSKKPFVRLGFRLMKGFFQHEASLIEKLQDQGVLSFEHENLPSIEKLRDLGIEHKTLGKLIRSNALRSLALNATHDVRRHQHWELLSLRTHDPRRPALKLAELPNAHEFLNPLNEWESLLEDATSLGFRTRVESLRAQSARHVAQYARESFFATEEWVRAEDIYGLSNNRRCRVIGLLCAKQRPPTAKGLAFMTLEDETGFLNLVLMPDIYERFRLIADSGKILAAEAMIQRSPLTDPQNPRSCSVTLKVTRLWNPFLEAGAKDLHLATKEMRYNARNYH
jgi:DNA polymerase-3 subunit alpha/error-prone DNA polymerase